MDQNLISHETSSRRLAWVTSGAVTSPNVLDVFPEDAPRLSDYWRVILKRRWLFLTCLLIVVFTVAVGTLKEKPVYEGDVLIEINPEEPNVLNFKEVLGISSADVDSYRETQYKILQSRTLAEHVVKDLKLYLLPEFYRGRYMLGLIERDPEKIPSVSDPEPPDPSSDAYRNSVQHLLKSIDITPIRRSNLVDVSFNSHDPKLAARVANKLADVYIDQNLQVKWDEALKASEWLGGQLVQLKANLEKSDDDLQRYAQANSILFVEEKQNLVNARLEQLQQEYTKVQALRFEKESQNNLVQAGKVQDLPGVLSNALIQNLTERLADLQREYAQLTATVKPDYPKAIALKKQIDAMQASLDQHKEALAANVSDEYQSAVADEAYLSKALDQAKRDVNDIAEKSIQYNILKREVDTNKQLYEGLLQRQKEAVVSAASRASNIRVVDAAQAPQVPVRPRVVLNLAVGLVLGLIFGVGLAFAQEYLDNTLKTPEEVETHLRLPSLGVLPKFQPIEVDNNPQGELVRASQANNSVRSPGIRTEGPGPVSIPLARSEAGVR